MKYINWNKYENCKHDFSGKPPRENADYYSIEGEFIKKGFTGYCIHCNLDHPDYRFTEEDKRKL